jgi:hypothetical protein
VQRVSHARVRRKLWVACLASLSHFDRSIALHSLSLVALHCVAQGPVGTIPFDDLALQAFGGDGYSARGFKRIWSLRFECAKQHEMVRLSELCVLLLMLSEDDEVLHL